MRIACYYPDARQGRNDGGPLYTYFNLCKILGKENVIHIWPQKDIGSSIYGKFDFHIWVDFGEDALGRGEDKLVCPKPNAYWTSDTHLGYEYRLKKAREFDYVFCAQRKAVDDFIRDGIPKERVFWLPHAFDPLAYSPGVFNVAKNNWDVETAVIPKYDVCFIGNLNDENRVRHLDRLFKEIPNFYWGTQRFHEAAEKFNQSRIVFNCSSKSELNMRHFEALGSRSFLLTDKIPEDQNVFKEYEHFVPYSGMDDMIDKARHYLSSDFSRMEIAQRGYEEAQKHTYLNRVLTILDTVKIPYDKDLAASLTPKEKVLEEAQCTSAA